MKYEDLKEEIKILGIYILDSLTPSGVALTLGGINAKSGFRNGCAVSARELAKS